MYRVTLAERVGKNGDQYDTVVEGDKPEEVAKLLQVAIAAAERPPMYVMSFDHTGSTMRMMDLWPTAAGPTPYVTLDPATENFLKQSLRAAGYSTKPRRPAADFFKQFSPKGTAKTATSSSQEGSRPGMNSGAAHRTWYALSHPTLGVYLGNAHFSKKPIPGRDPSHAGTMPKLPETCPLYDSLDDAERCLKKDLMWPNFNLITPRDGHTFVMRPVPLSKNSRFALAYGAKRPFAYPSEIVVAGMEGWVGGDRDTVVADFVGTAAPSGDQAEPGNGG